MLGAEWPLVAFTILVQTAIGLVIVSELACWAGGVAARDLLKGRECVALVLGVVGLAFSFAHLGMPIHAPYALLNIGSSWLSREIFCTSFFLACLVALAVTRYTAAFARFSGLVAGVACVAGFVDIFAMARVYLIVTVPAWNSPATTLSFLGTAALLGAMAAGVLAWLRWPAGRIGNTIPGFAALGFALTCVAVPVSLFTGMETNARGISGASAVLAGGVALYLLGFVLLLGGVALFFLAAVRGWRGRALPALAGGCALLLVLAGEVIGRFMFFNMHVLIGL